MKKRVRSRQTHFDPGTVYTVTSPGGPENLVGTAYVTSPELDITDYHEKQVRLDGSLPPSACQITSHVRDPFRMNRATGTIRFRNHRVTNDGFTSVAGFNNVRPVLDSTARTTENNDLALKLLASTNPLRPEFSVPVAIKEMVEIASLFKIAGKTFAGLLGSSYLNYKFGWEQFLRDLRTLSSITIAVERRIKEFDSLNKSGGLRRKVNLLAKSSSYYNESSILQSAHGVTIYATVTGTYQCQTSGTVRWRYREGYATSLDKLRGFNRAVTQVFDLGLPDSQTVWNLVPFSWLFDYFFDLNSYFGAGAGSSILEPYDICIIRRSKSNFSQKVISKPSSITLTGSGQYGRELYERDVVAASSLTVPSVGLLNANQALIIAALLASFRR